MGRLRRICDSTRRSNLTAMDLLVIGGSGLLGQEVTQQACDRAHESRQRSTAARSRLSLVLTGGDSTSGATTMSPSWFSRPGLP